MDLGKQQLIREINDDATDNDPMASEEYSTVLSTIRQMEHYAKYIMTDASVDIKTRLRCRNDFRMCAEWASRGLCHSTSSRATKDDVLFMMNFCPLACGTCHLLESFHKCVGRRHPHAQPSFESGGDLRSFFDKATTVNGDGSIEGDWAEYEPVLASDGKDDGSYVVIFQNFVSDEEADHLTSLGSAIDNGLTASTIKTPTTSSDDTTTNVNNAEYASCHDDDQCDSDDVYQRIMNRIASLSDSISISHLEPMAFKRLHPTSAEKSLQHNFEVGSSWKPAGPRVLSLSLFLWTVSDDDGNESGGGGIGFPYLDWLYVRPRKGTAVLWTNVREDDLIKPDLSMRFEYMPVQNGGGGEESVVVSTVHVHLYNWTDANMRGCA
jgi:prolyl 4-hydroxylase